MPAKKIHLIVITPNRAVVDQQVSALVVPAFDGEWGVLPGHAAMVGLLGTGALRLTAGDGRQRLVALRGGFVQVKDDRVTVLTPEAVLSEEASEKNLSEEMVSLGAEKAATPEAVEAKAAGIAWVKAQRKALAGLPNQD
jgi:F-type H+-transporting ATPase subunit epsilon